MDKRKQERLEELDREFCKKNFRELATEAQILKGFTDEHRRQLIAIRDEIGEADFKGSYRIVRVYDRAMKQPECNASRAEALVRIEGLVDWLTEIKCHIRRNTEFDYDTWRAINFDLERIICCVTEGHPPWQSPLYELLLALNPEDFYYFDGYEGDAEVVE
ncbi:MAG: hypothetical protein ACXV5H_10760 [Halobacteriota archaeon]